MDLPGEHCVLVVDDDPGIRLLLATCLRLRGIRSRLACNGREALENMRAGIAELVIMDLMMPEVSGWDVLRERLADPSLQRLPIIVITANNLREVKAGVIGQHVYAVLAKPFDLDTLLTTVTTCLEHLDVPEPLAA
ncbi:MAG TPA: response regulator [Thermoanaerobaculia bacterium]|nr:response regulator [Thermoanaerobaculia bacterium]